MGKTTKHQPGRKNFSKRQCHRWEVEEKLDKKTDFRKNIISECKRWIESENEHQSLVRLNLNENPDVNARRRSLPTPSRFYFLNATRLQKNSDKDLNIGRTQFLHYYSKFNSDVDNLTLRPVGGEYGLTASEMDTFLTRLMHTQAAGAQITRKLVEIEFELFKNGLINGEYLTQQNISAINRLKNRCGPKVIDNILATGLKNKCLFLDVNSSLELQRAAKVQPEITLDWLRLIYHLHAKAYLQRLVSTGALQSSTCGWKITDNWLHREDGSDEPGADLLSLNSEGKIIFIPTNELMSEHFISPDKIYNLDEKPFESSPRYASSKLVAGRTWTLSICISATGKLLRPAIIIPSEDLSIPGQVIQEIARARLAYPGSIASKAKFFVRANGFHNRETFFSDVASLMPKLNGTWDSPALLIIDGASCHLDSRVIESAREHHVFIAIMPSHTSTSHQPLDNGPFSLFEDLYLANFETWVALNREMAQIPMPVQMELLLKTIAEWEIKGAINGNFRKRWHHVGLPDGRPNTTAFLELSRWRAGRPFRDQSIPLVTQQLLTELFKPKNLIAPPRASNNVLIDVYQKTQSAHDLRALRKRSRNSFSLSVPENTTLYSYIIERITRTNVLASTQALKTLYFGKGRVSADRLTDISANLEMAWSESSDSQPEEEEEAQIRLIPPWNSAFGAELTSKAALQWTRDAQEKAELKKIAADRTRRLFEDRLRVEGPIMEILSTTIDPTTDSPCFVHHGNKFPSIPALRRFLQLKGYHGLKKYHRIDFIEKILQFLNLPIPPRAPIADSLEELEDDGTSSPSSSSTSTSSTPSSSSTQTNRSSTSSTPSSSSSSSASAVEHFTCPTCNRSATTTMARYQAHMIACLEKSLNL